MKLSQSPLYRIYSYCSVLICFKRKLFISIQLDSLPTSLLKEQISMSSTKVYACLKKLLIQLQTYLADFVHHSKYSDHLSTLQHIITKLKNNSELLTQEEKLINDAFRIMDEWQQTKDPIIYYEIKQRVEVCSKLRAILKEMQISHGINKQTKKPLYIRKLQRELRDNLQMIGEQQSSYNAYQSAICTAILKRTNKLLSKLLGSISKISRDSLVQEEKNQLLKNYIDLFNDKGSSLTEKQFVNYRRDLCRTLANIQAIFLEEKRAFMLLLQYLSDTGVKVREVQSKFKRVQDEISREVINIPEDIDAIVSFHQTFDIIDRSKCYFECAQDFIGLKQQLAKLEELLEEAIASSGQFLQSVRVRDIRSRVNVVERFIQDKKVMQGYVKRQKMFESNLFETFIKFLKRIYRNFNTPLQNSSNQQFNNIRHQGKYEKLFDTYFSEVSVNEKSERQSASTSALSNSGNVSRVKEIEGFIQRLQVFAENVDSTDSYQCSLGPRLLIHGRMRVLPKGIHYSSNFNKRNLFFGRTSLFLPKEQIFQINKQTAFLLFPDVIEVITKKGGVYFHSLGKRQVMFQHLNEMFFPEVNADNSNTAEDIPYHQFKGSESDMQNAVNNYMDKLEYEIVIGDIPNCTVRSLFTKYYSTEEFVYQGKIYKDFKYYTIQAVEGTNTKGTDFTPGVPYYMKLVTQSASENQNYPESERYFTYGKNIPMIPLVSKGGQGICQQKSIFRWGGPRCFIIQIFTTLSGFSLTEGMMVHSRQVFRQREGGVHCEMSGQITFKSNSAINGMLRSPALSNIKQFSVQIFQLIKKMEKNKRNRVGNKKIGLKEQSDQIGTRIEQLQAEVRKARSRLKWTVISFVCLYVLTLMFYQFK